MAQREPDPELSIIVGIYLENIGRRVSETHTSSKSNIPGQKHSTGEKRQATRTTKLGLEKTEALAGKGGAATARREAPPKVC